MKSKFRVLRLAAAINLLLLIFLISSCAEKQEKTTTSIFAMDTVMFLTAYGSDVQDGLDAASGEIFRLAAVFDPKNPSGELFALNNSNGCVFYPSEDLAYVLNISHIVFSQTDGALNPAVYPLVKEWGFISGGEKKVPDEGIIEALLQSTDFKSVEISPKDSSVDDGSEISVTLPSSMELGFGAVAKGYAAQLAIDKLRETGVKSAIINLGGNVQTLGLKPGGEKWIVGIREPNASADTYIAELMIGEAAVVTTGGYERFFTQNGRSYHHIIDPATGRPSDSGLLSVTVICENGGLADALSTALFVMGADDAFKYYDRYGGFEMVLIADNGDVMLTAGLLDCFSPSTDNTDNDYSFLVWRPALDNEDESGNFYNIM